jgi:hypothetical protein
MRLRSPLGVRVVGVDGCRAGWLCAYLHATMPRAEVLLLAAQKSSSNLVKPYLRGKDSQEMVC